MANEADRVKYRRLNVGEVIEAGDEYQSEETKVWRCVPGIVVGKVVDKDHLPLRRLCLCGAQPSQHRDLPEQVALLWASLGDIIGRVVRLEGEMDAGQDEEAAPAEGMRKERGESVRVVDEANGGMTYEELDTANGHLSDMVESITAERDAAIRERDEARRAVAVKHDHALQFRSERDAALVRVAELEGAAAPVANAGGEKQQPVGYGVRTEWGQFRAGLYTSQRAPANLERGDEVVPLYDAPPPRGWLTEEMRDDLDAALEWLNCQTNVFAKRAAAAIATTLARSSPPRVRKVNCIFAEETRDWHAWKLAETKWIAAIREAGGEVE